MKILAIINQKGGVGKSTTALSIGAAFAKKKKKVLYVDLDAQGNLSFSMGADTVSFANAMGVLEEPSTINEEIQHTAQGDILASSPSLAGADTVITTTGKEYRLQEALSKLTNTYDYCIIDTPPALGILTINALTACEGIIIPAQADIYSLQGISQLSGTVETVKKYCNPNLRILGIVLTRYNSRSVISREVAEQIEEVARGLSTKLFKTKIRECTAIKEAQAMQESIFTYAPRCNAVEDYSALAKEIEKEV